MEQENESCNQELEHKKMNYFLDEQKELCQHLAEASVMPLPQSNGAASMPKLYEGEILFGWVGYEIQAMSKLEGGQGEVYKASSFYRNGQQLFFAVKAPKQQVSELARELAVYFAIDPSANPHLALLSDAVPHLRCREVPLLVTEWADGGSLKSWLQKQLNQQTTTPDEHESVAITLEVALQVLRGLQSLHDKHNIVHQDVKPANLLLFGEPRSGGTKVPLLKLADFGFCVDGDDSKANLVGNVDGGTFCYMAPDQARAYVAYTSAGLKSKSADLWAFGLVLLETVGGVFSKRVWDAVQLYKHLVFEKVKATRVERKAKGAIESMENYIKDEVKKLLKSVRTLLLNNKVANINVIRVEDSKDMIIAADLPHAGVASRVGDFIVGANCSAWCCVVDAAEECLAEAGDNSASALEEKLNDAYEALTGKRYAAWTTTSMQSVYARKHFEAYSPNERVARFHLITNDPTKGAELLLNELAQKMNLSASLIQQVATRLSQPDNLLPLAVDTLAALSDAMTSHVVGHAASVVRACCGREQMGALGVELQRAWLRAKDKTICSRRLGSTGDADSPLHMFCERGASEAVAGILLALDDINTRIHWSLLQCRTEKETPLHLACYYGHTATALELLKGLPDMMLLLVTKNDQMDTPLHLACQNGHTNTVRELLNLLNSEQKMILLQANGRHKATPLHSACWNRHFATALNLLSELTTVSKVALLEIGNNKNATPLYLACYSGDTETVSEMLRGLPVEEQMILLLKGNDRKFTPLHKACEFGHTTTVRAILTELDSTNKLKLLKQMTQEKKNSNSPLHLACLNGHEETAISVLFEARAQISDPQLLADILNARNTDNKTAAQYANDQDFKKLSQELASTAAAIEKSMAEVQTRKQTEPCEADLLHVLACYGGRRLSAQLGTDMKKWCADNSMEWRRDYKQPSTYSRLLAECCSSGLVHIEFEGGAKFVVITHNQTNLNDSNIPYNRNNSNNRNEATNVCPRPVHQQYNERQQPHSRFECDDAKSRARWTPPPPGLALTRRSLAR